VTAISAVSTYSAVILVAFVPPGVAMSSCVVLLLLLGYALDSADGQLARLTGMGRPSGEWLDHVIDMGKICFLNAAVAISWMRWGVFGEPAGLWALSLALLSLIVSVLAFFGWMLRDMLLRVAAAEGKASVPTASAGGSGQASVQEAPALRSLLRLPSDYGLFALSFAWFAASFFVYTYGLLLLVNSVILVAALPTWFRQLRAQENIPTDAV
jgi:phosphatidylglycerophosphate synthase